MRSSAVESQALIAQRERELARARTRGSTDEARGDGAAVTNGEAGDEIPREDFENAPRGEFEGAPIDDAPRWPDEASEASFLAEQGNSGATVGAAGPRAVFSPKKNDGAIAASGEGVPEAPVTLPPLQSLIDRLPAAARETLEDLFRARFVSVKQIQKEALKN